MFHENISVQEKTSGKAKGSDFMNSINRFKTMKNKFFTNFCHLNWEQRHIYFKVENKRYFEDCNFVSIINIWFVDEWLIASLNMLCQECREERFYRDTSSCCGLWCPPPFNCFTQFCNRRVDQPCKVDSRAFLDLPSELKFRG